MEFIFLMHDDAIDTVAPSDWPPYLEKLEALGVLRGGSAIGNGICLRRDQLARALSGHISGYVKIKTTNLETACDLLTGNPVHEAGGTVEIRALPRTD